MPCDNLEKNVHDPSIKKKKKYIFRVQRKSLFFTSHPAFVSSLLVYTGIPILTVYPIIGKITERTGQKDTLVEMDKNWAACVNTAVVAYTVVYGDNGYSA